MNFARLLGTLVLLNAPFWWLASHLFLPRAIFSLDSVLALLLLALSPWLGAAALAVSWASDLTMASSLTYNFASVLEFMRSVAFAKHLSWGHLFGLNTILLAGPFGLAALGLRLLQPQRLHWPTVAGALLALVLLDTANGSSALSKRDVRLLGANLTGSSWLAMGRAALDESSPTESLSSTGASGGVTEFEALLPGVIAGQESVLYVLVESLGFHQDPAIRDWLARQLVPPELGARYALRHGQVAVNGATTAGELRRLCGLQGSYRKLSSEQAEHCLPQQMANSGRSTLGLHGFSEKMFDRQRWWPLLGLQQLEFAEQMAPRLDRQCGGAFQGICDEDLIARAVAASANPHSFVYALTLNTHLPIPPITIPPDLAGLCTAAKTGNDVCRLLAQFGVLLRSIPHELLKQGATPHVVVVGDHPPPFTSMPSRQQFATRVVPILTLAPQAAQRP